MLLIYACQNIVHNLILLVTQLTQILAYLLKNHTNALYRLSKM